MAHSTVAYEVYTQLMSEVVGSRLTYFRRLTKLHRDIRSEYYDCQEHCWKVNVKAERANDKIREAGGKYDHQVSVRSTM
jgi:hypothetical protein